MNTLFDDRFNQAEQTLLDAEEMLGLGSHSKYVLRRAYYSMIYGVLSLFAKDDVEFDTSDHAGVISAFKREYIHTGKVDMRYYKLLNDIFEIREASYSDGYLLISHDVAATSIAAANNFLSFVRSSSSPLD